RCRPTGRTATDRTAAKRTTAGRAATDRTAAGRGRPAVTRGHTTWRRRTTWNWGGRHDERNWGGRRDDRRLRRPGRPGRGGGDPAPGGGGRRRTDRRGEPGSGGRRPSRWRRDDPRLDLHRSSGLRPIGGRPRLRQIGRAHV